MQKITTKEQLVAAIREARDQALMTTDRADDLRIYVNNNVELGKRPLWKIREQIRKFEKVMKPVRFFEGTLDDKLHVIEAHFVYRSEDKNTPLISYIPDEKHGEEDRRLKTKLGKYLNKYYSNILTEDTIRTLSTEYNSGTIPYTLHIAEGADEIETVYRECATGSCMSKDRDFWPYYDSAGVHPTHVYDSPDVDLAYVKDPQGRIVARTLINKLTNTWVRIYGHEKAMLYLLRQKDIDTQSGLLGVRLKRIDIEDRGVVCPYLDGEYTYVTMGDEWLTVVDDRDDIDQPIYKHPNYQYALLEETEQSQCPDCGDYEPPVEDYMIETNQDRYPCYNCFENRYKAVDILGAVEPPKLPIPLDQEIPPLGEFNDSYYEYEDDVQYKIDVGEYIQLETGVVISGDLNADYLVEDEDTGEIMFRSIDTLFIKFDSKGLLVPDFEFGRADKTRVMINDFGAFYIPPGQIEIFKQAGIIKPYEESSNCWVLASRVVQAIDSPTTTVERFYTGCVFHAPTNTWYTEKYIDKLRRVNGVMLSVQRGKVQLDENMKWNPSEETTLNVKVIYKDIPELKQELEEEYEEAIF
jgi:hypothetical protein